MTSELNKISQLPGHIMDQILSHLPIKDAVRTSILSRKWRYKWSSVPQLVFNDQCTRATRIPSLQPSLYANLVKIIDKVLLLHTSPIQKFKLSHEEFFATSDIDHWILHLFRVCVKEIVLDIWTWQYYEIPSSLFNCQYLIQLELYRCLVQIPLMFEGFHNLESLDLQHIQLSLDGLKALISRCPLLKRLKLRNLEGIKQINIDTGNLGWLDVEGAFQDVAFGVMNNLMSLMVGFSNDIANKCGSNYASSNNLRKLFRNLPKLHSLILENYSLKYLGIGNAPQTLLDELVHLNYLFTYMDVNGVGEILTVMCLDQKLS